MNETENPTKTLNKIMAIVLLLFLSFTFLLIANDIVNSIGLIGDNHAKTKK